MIDLSLDDQKHLMNVLRFAGRALDHVADVGHDRKRLDASWLHRDAVAYCILAAGELVGEVEYDLEKEIPQIIWSDLIGMRNRLAHNPTNINPDIVWGVVTYHFPLLISTLEPMLDPQISAD